MSRHRKSRSHVMCLVALGFLPGCATAAEPGPADPGRPAATAIQALPAAGGVVLGEIGYVPADLTPDPTLEDAILAELPGYQNCVADPAEAVRYLHAAVDLNADQQPETIVYLVGSYTCGTGGCTALIFDSAGPNLTPIARISLVRTPILVSDQATDGWRDLVLLVAGGGAPTAYHVLRHGTDGYPSNPSVAPMLDPGAVLAGEAQFADDIAWDTPAPMLLAKGCPGAEGDLLLAEGLGALRVDLAAEQVVAVLGRPEIDEPPLMWEADALFHQTWRYPADDIELDMVSDTPGEAQRVGAISIGPSSGLTTRQGIGIGASYAEVAAAYAAVRDDESSEPPVTFVAGSPYGGLVFTFEDDQVSQIFLGTAAE